MILRKTLFKKYLFITLSTVLLSFFVLGTMLLIFISRHLEEEKHKLLTQNAENVTSLMEENNIIIFSEGQVHILNRDLNLVNNFIRSFSTNIDADIFVADKEGNIIFYPENNEKFKKTKVPKEIMKIAINGRYIGNSDFEGIYEQDRYAVGIPITVRLLEGPIGAVFTVSDQKYITKFREDILKIFAIAFLAALMISFLAIGGVSYKMVKPLREMAIVAKRFGDEDFSDRVPAGREDEIGQLAIAFNNMAESLSISENIRRSFVANVSHELKTPMTTISGFVDGILDGTIPNDKQNDYLKIVSEEIKRLSRLVRSMLNLSRIDSGKLKLNKKIFFLKQTIFSILLTFEKQIEKKYITIKGLENTDSIVVEGDSDLIHQVIYNLIENAVKFVNFEGKISFHIEKFYDRVVVGIKNTGQGIPKSEIGFVFDRFYKTDKSRSQDKNGMGLGLYIVKTIIKLHGGDIIVKSIEGEYCEFIFWVPINSKLI
ncbi:MAG: HAMP domain-containing histidine kinase [Oscillospiraceae bacterium]|jgi:signal transduction histidine kinase|nr:HAMP domain-containing histidine kinase [Oscillospiraceae bacterium]